jgi:hypothetical protein
VIKEKKATLVLSTVKLLYRQTKKAQSDRSSRVPEGEKKLAYLYRWRGAEPASR